MDLSTPEKYDRRTDLVRILEAIGHAIKPPLILNEPDFNDAMKEAATAAYNAATLTLLVQGNPVNGEVPLDARHPMRADILRAILAETDLATLAAMLAESRSDGFVVSARN